MWIRTQKNQLCNLKLATDIVVAPSSDPNKSTNEVRVFFVSGGEVPDRTVVFEGTKSECVAYLVAIAELVKANPVG